MLEYPANAIPSVPQDSETLNRYGDVAGSVEISNQSTYDTEAVYWNSAGAPTVLTSLGNGNIGGLIESDYVASINNIGDIGGVSDNEATMWSDNDSIIWHGNNNSSINSINGSGDAVGHDGSNAAYWSPTGAETLLANPGGAANEAIAINAYGRSVGYSGVEPVEWAKDGHATVLRDLPGATSAEGTAINASGASVGYSTVDGKVIATYWARLAVR